MKRLLNQHELQNTMKIKNFEFKGIEAERYSERGEKKGNIKVDHNSSVTNIKNIDPETNVVEFKFTAGYSSVGMIKLKGALRIKGDFPDLADEWRENKKMPNEVAKKIHTVIIKKCIPQAVTIAKDLNLPPPIPLPKINVKGKKQKNTTSPGGMEVA